MATGNGLKALRKEEFSAFKIVGRNRKKLEEIENKLETKKLDLMELSIEQQRLDNEYNYKYSNDSANAPESWAKYLRIKRGLEERIRQLDDALMEEKRKEKECFKQSERAKKIGNQGEASSWTLEAKDHQDIEKQLKLEISDYHGEIIQARKRAEADPEYMELQSRIKLAKEKFEALQREIFDLQREQKAQKRIYEDAVKNHKIIKEKIEKIQKTIYT